MDYIFTSRCVSFLSLKSSKGGNRFFMKFIQFLIRMFIDPETKAALEKTPGRQGGVQAVRTVLAGHFRKLTLYNPVGLLAALVFTGTLFYPWWQAYVYNNEYIIWAYPFILRHNLPSEGEVYVIETPVAAVVFLICLLAGYLFLAFWGSTMEGKKGRLFLFWTGIFMLLYAAGFYGALLFATHRIHVPVTGYAYILHTVQVDIFMSFTREYFIAMGSAGVCLLSPLLHGRPALPVYGRKRTP